MNGIMASTWLRYIPAGSDQDILMDELKKQSFLFKRTYLAVSLGIGHMNRFAYVREHLLAPGEQPFCRSSTLPIPILPQIM